MSRWAAAVAAGLLLSAGLTACSSTTSYCDTLKADKSQLTRLAKQSAGPGKKGGAALGRTVTLLSTLRDQAPDDIDDDWDTLVQALKGLSAAVRSSGAGPADFASGRRPDGVSASQDAAVRQAAAELSATPVQQATASIEQHARDVCKVDLGTGLRG